MLDSANSEAVVHLPTTTEKRKVKRELCSIPALLVHKGAFVGRCVIVDRSIGGAKLSFDKEVPLPSCFQIITSGFIWSANLIWMNDERAGVEIWTAA